MPVFEVDDSGSNITAVRFSNGTINRRDVSVKLYTRKEDESTDSQKQQIVATRVDGISYVGKNYGPSNRFPVDTCDYYIGIHDRLTGKVKVVPASLVQLEPLLEDKEDDSSSLAFNSKTDKEKTYALATEFGSGRSQRTVNKKIREKLDDEMLTATAKSMVDAAPAEAMDDSQPLSSQSEAIPPYNLEAATPDDVYKLKDLINMEVLESLTESATAITAFTQEDLATWKQEKKYFGLVLAKLETISDQAPARKLQGQCLVYLQYLMQVYLMKSHQMRVKYPLPKEWPLPVRDHLLKLFTLEVKEPGRRMSRSLPQRMRDLLLSHILVFCLKMSEFSLDLSPLVEDLKIAAKKLCTHCSSLGCVVKKTKQGGRESFVATLKVPLTFPIVRDKAAKKRIF